MPKIYSNIQIFLNEIFVGQPACLPASQPNHRKHPTTQTTAGPTASILSQSKGYFYLHKPFLFWE